MTTNVRPGKDRRVGAIAGLIMVASLGAAAGAVAATAVMAGIDRLTFDPQSLGGVSTGVGYAIIGWIVASHVSGNRIGWVFLTIGLSQTVEAFASGASNLGLVVAPGRVPLADLWSWVAVWAWVPGLMLLLTFSLLLYPDGRLPSPRWRWVGGLSIVSAVLLGIPMAIVSWPYRGITLASDGMGSVGGAADVARALQFVGMVCVVVAAIASVASMVGRFRGSRGVERQQLKWFTAAAIPVIGTVFVTANGSISPLVALFVSLLAGPLMPIATGLAILRYRLFDIDRLVSRTIGWLVVTAVLAGVFALGILLAQSVLKPVTGGSTIGVAASTLLASALFAPVRRRVQRAVDRRFNRARYDAERTAAAFAERLRDEVDLGTLRADLGAVIATTLEPASVVVWVRKAGVP